MIAFAEAEAGSKAGQIQKTLLALATERGPGIKLPTMRELCDRLGVARGTLERALEPLERRGLLLRKHGSGIYVTERICQKTIGVVFGGDIFGPDFSPFWGLLLQAVRTQAGARGDLRVEGYLDISQSASGFRDHAQLLEALEARRLDGLLLFSPHYTFDHAGQLRAFGVPLVVLGEQVTMDWARFSRLAVADLRRHRPDCRRIGFMGAPQDRPAFAAELQRAGMAGVAIEDWSYETYAEIIPGVGSRENCARLLLEHKLATATAPLPEVLVSLQDDMTRGAVTALYQAGKRPGHDLHIISADNAGSPLLLPYVADLVLIDFDPRELVQAMLEVLGRLLAGEALPATPVSVPPYMRKSAVP